MQLDVEWYFHQWPPTNEKVIVLFDTSTYSSLSNFPRLYEGYVKSLDRRNVAFFPDGEIHPLHPHFIPVAWRYADAFRSKD